MTRIQDGTRSNRLEARGSSKEMRRPPQGSNLPGSMNLVRSMEGKRDTKVLSLVMRVLDRPSMETLERGMTWVRSLELRLLVWDFFFSSYIPFIRCVYLSFAASIIIPPSSVLTQLSHFLLAIL